MSAKVTCTPRTFHINVSEEGAEQLKALLGNVAFISDELGDIFWGLVECGVEAEFDDYFKVDGSLEMWPK